MSEEGQRIKEIEKESFFFFRKKREREKKLQASFLYEWGYYFRFTPSKKKRVQKGHVNGAVRRATTATRLFINTERIPFIPSQEKGWKAHNEKR